MGAKYHVSVQKPAIYPQFCTLIARAVVLGARMAGLSAAAVLAPRFGDVVILERDLLPDEPGDRKGVPQGRHVHALLPAGLQRLEGWFPGLTDELVAAGARLVDFGSDGLWHQGGGFRARFTAGLKGPVASRALLEHHLRRRVLGLPNVSLVRGGATGLATTPDAGTVTGVTLEDGTVVEADLVVDATGRAARSVRWLSDLGYQEAPAEDVMVDVGYASRILHRDPAQDPG
jgi:2-polyprenyl-6-methoxyphenol hydroxylase-like FAD-dependent oxidoreductase